MDRKKRPMIAAILAVLLLGPVAGWLTVEGLRDRRLAEASVQSTCNVLGAGVEEDGDDFVPWVILVQTVAGERYERRDEGTPVESEGDARQAIRALTPGQQVPCRYADEMPSLVTYFEPDTGPANTKLGFAGGLAWIIVATVGWAVIRARRAEA